ncbi:transmembrane protein 45B-like [Panulirus ornatus]|uniref:transmembrane protein 45B-like n=1 Tax=Panulirus ornatus TaxID=150431 RepID=UPI003A894EC0
MGSFMGHVLPGSFFTMFGLWWAYNIFQRYHLCQRVGRTTQDNGHRPTYTNTSTFPFSCYPGLPLEGILKVAVTTIGMTGELITAFVHGTFTHMGNSQHMTMYFFFGVNGAVDIMMHYRAPLPPDTDYVSALLAFIVEGILFLHHLHGRTEMDIQLHMLLVYVVGACVISIALEMSYKSSVLPALARAYFVLLQGMWFLQVGFILYPPVGSKWNEESPRQMMLATNILCWHMAAIFILLLVMGWIIHHRVKALSPTSLYHNLHSLSHTNVNYMVTKLDTEQVQRIIADSDEEEV